MQACGNYKNVLLTCPATGVGLRKDRAVTHRPNPGHGCTQQQ